MTVHSFDYAESTNLLAEQYAAIHPDEAALFIAKRQSGGRGRLGRSFSSEEGGLYMSLLLPIPADMTDTVGFTAFCGVKTAEAIEDATGLNIGIKWVNDLILEGRKLGGIMTRGIVCPDTGRITHLVVGIGINIKNPLPSELSDIAIRICDLTDRVPDAGALGWSIARRIGMQMESFLNPSVLSEYRRRLTLMGRDITVYTQEGEYEATVIDVNPDYSLLIALPDGDRISLYTGEVSVRERGKNHQNPFKSK